ncbi:hypothetical protein CLV47_102436 [Antricoccus suffuscus]|uniref:Uncharacterized protein n=1 Tax=Antricoccus suffuscus TaxID=1629062 RepID=A0A2T1A561_9ACTN|nr:hypothetical protein [Antricoccus suffuscus]PRZ43745.1 hypothetical protein CLV47_102436 [Antricoccus suffuscus]
MGWDRHNPERGIPQAVRAVLCAGVATGGVALWMLYGTGSFFTNAALAVLLSLCAAAYILGAERKSATVETDSIRRPAPPRPLAARPIQVDTKSARRRTWDADVARHEAILLSYLPYETDPHVVMRYPAITDLTQEPTADFFDALHAAGSLRTESYPDDQPTETAYGQRVAALARAWAAAERHAKQRGTSYLDPVDARRLAQASKLLRHAEGATTEAERAAYLHQVKALVDVLIDNGAVALPAGALAQIGSVAARSLTERAPD